MGIEHRTAVLHQPTGADARRGIACITYTTGALRRRYRPSEAQGTSTSFNADLGHRHDATPLPTNRPTLSQHALVYSEAFLDDVPSYVIHVIVELELGISLNKCGNALRLVL